MTKADQYIEKYKYLEQVTSEKYNLNMGDSPIAFLERRREFAHIKEKLTYCREVRNFLQHEVKINNEFAIIPSDSMISLIDEVTDLVLNPKKCCDIAIKINDIYYKKLDDFVFKSLKSMSHKRYTHIPILENGVLKGVFSKATVFNYIIENEVIKLRKTLRFRDIIKYIPITGDDSEKYVFAKYYDSVANIKELFENSYKNAIKIGIVFLTQNGRAHEKILGIITLYDLIK